MASYGRTCLHVPRVATWDRAVQAVKWRIATPATSDLTGRVRLIILQDVPEVFPLAHSHRGCVQLLPLGLPDNGFRRRGSGGRRARLSIHGPSAAYG